MKSALCMSAPRWQCRQSSFRFRDQRSDTGPRCCRENRAAPGLDGEIDVLRNVTRRLDDSQGVEFGGDHADNIAAVVMQRSAAITGLNRAR